MAQGEPDRDACSTVRLVSSFPAGYNRCCLLLCAVFEPDQAQVGQGGGPPETPTRSPPPQLSDPPLLPEPPGGTLRASQLPESQPPLVLSAAVIRTTLAAAKGSSQNRIELSEAVVRATMKELSIGDWIEVEWRYSDANTWHVWVGTITHRGARGCSIEYTHEADGWQGTLTALDPRIDSILPNPAIVVHRWASTFSPQLSTAMQAAPPSESQHDQRVQPLPPQHRQQTAPQRRKPDPKRAAAPPPLRRAVAAQPAMAVPHAVVGYQQPPPLPPLQQAPLPADGIQHPPAGRRDPTSSRDTR
jgi:hypothetical protein